MARADWTTLVSLCADPTRAGRVLAQLRETEARRWLDDATPDSARALVAVAAGSQFLGELMTQRPGWLPGCFDESSLRHGRRLEGLRREVDGLVDAALQVADHAGALDRLRRFKLQEHLRIAARDLGRFATTARLTLELSEVADVVLASVQRICRAQLASRFGEPWHQDPDGAWHPTPFCVLGLGKLGGQELNYSSDVDVLFVYADEGTVFRAPPVSSNARVPGGAMTSHQFFTRLAEAFIAEVGRTGEGGLLYRIDLRLRPEGDAGPLARSLESYENFYAQWGQTWERMMLLKGRPVAGDRQLGAEFLELIQPFRYPRSLNPRMVDEIAATKRRLETEVVQGDAERDVKRGRGGIREIEFIVQSLQLINGGRQPFLQTASTLTALEKLCDYGHLTRAEADGLGAAYGFLRDVEHRLQMENNFQTHTLPVARTALDRLARTMLFGAAAAFESARRRHTQFVRQIYERILGPREATSGAALPGNFTTERDAWLGLLRAHAFRDPERALKLLREFVHGPGYAHVSTRTEDLARQLIPMLLALCPGSSFPRPAGGGLAGVLSDPDRVLARIDTFVTAYGSRAPLYDAWASHPQFFELLLWLFDRSEFLAEVAIRTPDLVEEMVLSGRLRRAKPVGETLRELRFGVDDADQRLWLRRYQRAEQMRLGLRDLLGLADLDPLEAELTALADACVCYALEVVQRRHHLRTAPFAVIALGKYGGAELSYGSDLDLVFVAPLRSRNLSRLQPMAVEFRELLSASTELGTAFDVDLRLRPNGAKGLLVNSLEACEEYWRLRGSQWELQALTRARLVGGHRATGEALLSLTGTLTDFSRGNPGVAVWSDHWRDEIVRMRRRIEHERTKGGREALAFKTGRGGLMDAEFLAQTFCLANGWKEPNTTRALERAVREGHLAEPLGGRLLTGYRQLRCLELILRRWSFQAESELPDDAAAQDRVAVRCGHADGAALLAAVAGARSDLRTAWDSVFGEAPARRRRKPAG